MDPNPTEKKVDKLEGTRRIFAWIAENPSLFLVIHYSCESFDDNPNGSSGRITSIAVRNLSTAYTESFSIHRVAEIYHYSNEELDQHYDQLERQMLDEFYGFVRNHIEYTWLHWNMRDIQFGFPALAHRYEVLGGQPVDIPANKLLDIAVLLKALYGENYIEHPRLTKLVERNNLQHKEFLKGEEEADAFRHKEYIRLHRSTLRKVAIFSTIVGRVNKGTLFINEENDNAAVVVKGELTVALGQPTTRPVLASIDRKLMRENTLTWLHLSDWHQGHKEFNRQVVRDALIKDIKERGKINSDLEKLDFIIFSGDVAYSGKKEEYQAAIEDLFDEVLKITGLSHDRLFIVPGNHDLNRSSLELLPQAILRPFKEESEVHKWLTDDAKLKRLLEPFHEFSTFVTDYTKQSSPAYASIRLLDTNGVQVALLGLNSALLCGRNKVGRKKEINDLGYLIVGEPQIHDALAKIATANVRIAILHHPFDWLSEFDRNRVESRLGSECHFILRGHVHTPQVQVTNGTGGNYVVIPAGASYDQRTAANPRYTNSYNFVHLSFASRSGTVYLRRWNDLRNKWIPDLDSQDNGMFEFIFPQGLGNFSPPVRAIDATNLLSEEDDSTTETLTLTNNGHHSLAGQSRNPNKEAQLLMEVRQRAMEIARVADSIHIDPFSRRKLTLDTIESNRLALIQLREALQNRPALYQAITEYNRQIYVVFTTKNYKEQDEALERADYAYREVLASVSGILDHMNTEAIQEIQRPKPKAVEDVTPVVQYMNFSDVHPNQDYYQAIRELVATGVINGYADGTFHPENTMTMGQLTKVIVLVMGWAIDCPNTAHFSDVPVNSAFFCFVETAYTHGIISGYEDGTLRAGNNLTRGQLSKIIVLAQGWVIDGHGGPHFIDVPTSHPLYNFIETMYNHGIISEDNNHSFEPDKEASRGEICEFLYRAIQ